MDVITLFNALNPVIANLIGLVVILIAVWGVAIGAGGLMDLYAINSSGAHLTTRSPSINGALIKLALAGAMSVFPVLMWFSANTFVNTGAETYSMFNYSGGSGAAGYCGRFKQTLTYYFMLLGVIAWGKAFAIGYAHGKGTDNGGPNAKYYLIFGTLVFFINDVMTAINTTLGTNWGLDNLCRVLGTN